MAKDLERATRELEVFLRELEIRIRRYTMDRKLSPGMLIRLNELHAEWLKLRREFYEKKDHVTAGELRAFDNDLRVVDRQIDIVQRDLVSAESFRAGTRTALFLAAALVALALVYLWSHGVKTPSLDSFERLAEWGPLKYLEVAVWAEFGVLCLLLFLAAHYVSRRDFDEWYQAWYLSTALRAPLLTVILMILVLEFTEWYAEGTWIEAFVLEEGNKSYFIAFMSFCLGIASDRTSEISRELSNSVADFVQAVVKKFGNRLRTAIDPEAAAK